MKSFVLTIALSFVFSVVGFSQNPTNLKSLTAAEFKKIIETKSVVLIDVRSEAEFADKHIPKAINIPVGSENFANMVKKAAGKKAVALYCRSGRRSKIAAAKLTELNIVIYELNWGFEAWLQAAYPEAK